MLGKRRRLALLAEASFSPLEAKTAVGVLRYRTDEVAAIIDSTRAGQIAQECVGIGGGIPIVLDVLAAEKMGADALLIGVAPQGGGLPDGAAHEVRAALERGWDVIAGLHVFLADDPELAALARCHGGKLIDVRRPPSPLRVARRLAAEVEALVVLTVGTDCNVGKMTTALELVRELGRRGLRAAFAATGQTGIMISDHGIAVDAVPADFVAGATERLVLDAARDADVVVVEGQGSLHHPGYSGVTLGLLHGACPAALVLCHVAGRTRFRITGEPAREFALPSLAEARDAYERAAAWTHPAAVVGVALNTFELDDDGARAACASAERAVGVPASDPVRFGAETLAEAIHQRWVVGRAALSRRSP